jgi:hypothetical protein
MIDKKPPKRPERIPTGSEHADKLWSLLNDCWKWKPEDRPTAGAVSKRVSGFHLLNIHMMG